MNLYVYAGVGVYVCMYVYTFNTLHKPMNLNLKAGSDPGCAAPTECVCMCVFMYVCMYVCMYV